MEPTFEPRETKSSAGPTVSIIIILFLVIAGAVYFWNVREQRRDNTPPYIPASESTSTTVSQ